MCNFGRGQYEKQSCKINLNLNQWYREICQLKKVLRNNIFRSCGDFVRWSLTVLLILVEGMWTIHLKLF